MRGANTNGKNADNMGRLTAGLTDNSKPVFTLFNDGTESGNMTFEMCLFFYSIQAEYSQEEQKEYLSGKWFSNEIVKYDHSLPAGKFVLEKISSEPDTNVDKYFPNLARLIKNLISDRLVSQCSEFFHYISMCTALQLAIKQHYQFFFRINPI
jgi:hypothetical protein